MNWDEWRFVQPSVKWVARVIHRKSAVINSNNYRRPKMSRSYFPIDLSVGVKFEGEEEKR
jgi:hypothetical protein